MRAIAPSGATLPVSLYLSRAWPAPTGGGAAKAILPPLPLLYARASFQRAVSRIGSGAPATCLALHSSGAVSPGKRSSLTTSALVSVAESTSTRYPFQKIASPFRGIRSSREDSSPPSV